jgi:hypothetical protein
LANPGRSECAILPGVKALVRALGLLAVLAFGACGGSAKDTTVLLDQPPAQPGADEAPRSQALDALAEPAAREAFCGWVGVSAANVAGRAGAPLDCSQVVQRCRQAASDVTQNGSLDVASGLLGGAGDLQDIIGCPVSFDVVDACLAQLIELSVARNPDGPGCGAASAPVEPFGVSDLPALPSCITVAVNCPALLRQLLAARR